MLKLTAPAKQIIRNRINTQMVRDMFLRAVFFLFLVSVSLAAAIFGNYQKITQTLQEVVIINQKEDYNLDASYENKIVKISGTPNRLFNTRGSDGKYFFPLKEYNFDFIIIADANGLNQTQFTCEDKTSDTETKNTLAEFMNKPLDIENIKVDDKFSISTYENILVNTAGSFGNATKLLDCAVSAEINNYELAFYIFVEALLILTGLVLIFRDYLFYYLKVIYKYEITVQS